MRKNLIKEITTCSVEHSFSLLDYSLKVVRIENYYNDAAIDFIASFNHSIPLFSYLWWDRSLINVAFLPTVL